MIIDAKVIPKLDRETLAPFHAAQVTAMNVPVALWHDHTETLQNLERMSALVERASDMLTSVRSTADISRCATTDTMGIVTSIASTAAIDDEIAGLEVLYHAGVRIAQPTFLARSAAGGSCADAHDAGLTAFGREFVSECDRLGIALDLSHVGDTTARQIMRLSQRPPFFAQAAPRELHRAARNKTDDDIRAIAERGGVVCIAALRQYLPRGGASTIDDFVDAVLHVVDVAGEEHVGIGSDLTPGQPSAFFDYVASSYGTGEPVTHSSADDATPGFADAAGYANLRGALAQRGLGPGSIERIVGGNLLRYFEAAWA